MYEFMELILYNKYHKIVKLKVALPLKITEIDKFSCILNEK